MKTGFKLLSIVILVIVLFGCNPSGYDKDAGANKKFVKYPRDIVFHAYISHMDPVNFTDSTLRIFDGNTNEVLYEQNMATDYTNQRVYLLTSGFVYIEYYDDINNCILYYSMSIHHRVSYSVEATGNRMQIKVLPIPVFLVNDSLQALIDG